MKKNLIITCILFCFFIIFTILVKFVDVGTTLIGSDIGLYNINTNLLPSDKNNVMDKISDICLYISFIAFFSVVCLGLYELITLKSFKKVDLSIYSFAIVSVLVIVFYFIFDKITINYRPILIDGKLECSYPSTHILMTTYFMFGAVYVYSNKIKNNLFTCICLCIATILSIITFLGRILSLNHWFTDCLGGLILALAFVMLLITLAQILTSKFNKVNNETVEA